MDSLFDYAVIGAGMMGSSCAKYITQDGARCLLVGPKSSQDGIYGAWMDEGRIVERVEKEPIERNLGNKISFIDSNK